MNIAIVGANGAVGRQLQDLLGDEEVTLFHSTSTISFEGLDLVFFCVSKERALELIPQALEKGAICIDASSAYRKDPAVPLIIPEINGHLLDQRPRLIASPNCTTTLMLLPLAPLHKRYRIKRIAVSTYQAVSGAGKKGMAELERQVRAYLEDRTEEPECFPTSCAFNVFPHESADEEEEKMRSETQKILDSNNVQVTARCIRVPVFRVHSQAVTVTFEEPIDLENVHEILQNSPGITVKENATSLDASNQLPVFCGNVRIDRTLDNTLEMWIVGDQLLKGAALNMVQIAQCLESQNKIESGGSCWR